MVETQCMKNDFMVLAFCASDVLTVTGVAPTQGVTYRACLQDMLQLGRNEKEVRGGGGTEWQKGFVNIVSTLLEPLHRYF